MSYKVKHFVVVDRTAWSGEPSRAPVADEWSPSLAALTTLPYCCHEVEVAKGALELATALMANMMHFGVPAPQPDLDAEGNVLMTWKDGGRIYTLLIESEHMQPLITENGKVRYVGSQLKVSFAALASLKGLLGGHKEEWKVKFPVSRYSSMMSRQFYDRFSFRGWLSASESAPVGTSSSPDASGSPRMLPEDSLTHLSGNASAALAR